MQVYYLPKTLKLTEKSSKQEMFKVLIPFDTSKQVNILVSGSKRPNQGKWKGPT